MNEQTNPAEDSLPLEGAGRGEGGDQSPSSQPSPQGEKEQPDLVHVKRVLEAALLSSTEPLSLQQLKRLFSGQVSADSLRKVLDQLKSEWNERSIELTSVA